MAAGNLSSATPLVKPLARGMKRAATAGKIKSTRIKAKADFMRGIGRARSPKAGTGVLSTVDELPFFLQAEAFKPFITDELRKSTKPVFFNDV